MLHSGPTVQRMQFRLLGALEAGSGSAVAELGPPKQRALLTILLLHVGEIVSVDRLIDLLWGEEAPRTATHSIQIYVSELRKALEPMAGHPLIHTRPPGYLLDVPDEAIDAKRFEALVREATARLTTGDHEPAARALNVALALWRGPALSDFALEEFAQPYVRRLNDLHLDAIETLASIELEAERASGVVPLLEAAIREDPLRERSRELLMLALYRSGRHAEALRTYERLRLVLDEELGIEPSPPLQRLRDRVLLHDPTLLPTTANPEPDAVTRNPYKGLQAFGEHDAQDFFGREVLVDTLLQAVGSGRGLVALVGPSGSGKSSAVAAGLVPRLRQGGLPGSQGWVVAPLALGADPMADLHAVVARLPEEVRDIGELLVIGGRRPAPESDAGAPRLVLVIDQFEQLFIAPEELRRAEFLAILATALHDAGGRLLVVLTLRADFYDRPLQQPEFSEVFIAGVVHVLPMTAHELERAIVEPAEQVGIDVEPALLAELVAHTVARPGGLPLLQYALTELFEQRAGTNRLSLAGYRALGGLSGVLTRRAEQAFLGLSADEQQVAMQVFMRLVRLGHGTADSRRRVTLSELTGLGTDAVVLSSVLGAFGRHRLLTFDHDLLTGEATVELAHEALLTEWERLAGWIDRHRAALRRRDAFLAAVEEWELAGRDQDYLLTGSRLADFAALGLEGAVSLTAREREFLEAGLERDRATAAEESARVEERRRLARSARTRLLGFGVAVVALAIAGAAWGFAALNPPPKPVAFMWTDRGLINTQLAAGFDRGITDFNLQGRKFAWEDLLARFEQTHGDDIWAQGEAVWLPLLRGQVRDEVRTHARDGVGLIVLGVLFPEDVGILAREFPEINFVGDGPRDLPNVAFPSFRDAEASYLAGAAAAMKSETGVIGYVGGVDWVGLWAWEAGYIAGAIAVDPDVTVLIEYLSVDPDFSGFDDQSAAREAAGRMYEQGADVILHAAGTSGLGVFEAAVAYSDRSARHVWAIGADEDQFNTVVTLPGLSDAERWRAHILTSVLKQLDQAVYEALRQHADGQFTPGSWDWGLASGASGISYSGGHLDSVRPQLESFKRRIISGDIQVPCIPESRREQAAALGIGAGECYH